MSDPGLQLPGETGAVQGAGHPHPDVSRHLPRPNQTHRGGDQVGCSHRVENCLVFIH